MGGTTDSMSPIYLLVILVSVTSGSRQIQRECIGSESFSLRRPHNVEVYYRQLYTNCTYVQGNLIISHLEPGMDTSMFQSIREVYGSVVVALNSMETIPLTSLVAIHGAVLYESPIAEEQDQLYSLYVAANEGLKELGMTLLQEIRQGGVLFKNNSMLCYERTIDWSYILGRQSTNRAMFLMSPGLQKTCQVKPCDASCGAYCWGDGSNLCQRRTNLNCSSHCLNEGLGCFGPGEDDCCHYECLRGCTGSATTNCLACRTASNNGRCVAYCPPRYKYNRNTRLREPNPDFRYLSGGLCVSQCGTSKYQDDFCVSQCSEGYYEETTNNTCIRCQGDCTRHIST